MTLASRSSRSRSLCLILLLISAVTLVFACGGGEPAAETEAADTETADTGAADTGAPRIFFIEPADGASVGTEVKLRFGAENFIIEPVGDGMIHEGAGHFHVGLDTECLPAGEVIPTADPWVHFGDGSAEIDYALPPGEHTLTIQIGDGEHRTLDEPGLCNTITVTALEESP